MKYDKVPFILTGKDMDYLTDSFNWEYSSFKNSVEAETNLSDDELAKHMSKASELFNNHMDTILSIIKEVSDEDSK